MKKICLLIILTGVLFMSACGRSDNYKQQPLEETNEKAELENNDFLQNEENENLNTIEAIESTNSYEEIDISDIAYDTRNFSYGKAWCKTADGWNCIDADGNVLFILDIGFEPAGDFINNLCLIKLESSKKHYNYFIIDEKGDYSFDKYLTANDSVLLLGDNNGEVEVWVQTIVDTYDSHVVKLKVLDGEGNVKAEFEPNEIMSESSMNKINRNMGNLQMYLESIGDGMYIYGDSVFNVNDNFMFNYDTGWDSINTLVYNENWGVDRYGNLVDTYGKICISSDGKGDGGGMYSEGVYYLGQWKQRYYDKNGSAGYAYCGNFYNEQGEVVIDISNLYVTDLPAFFNDYCVLELVNDQGVTFVTAINKKGEFLFEPIEGRTKIGLYLTGDNLSVPKYISEDILVVYNLEGDLKPLNIYGETVEWTLQIELMSDFHNGWARFSNTNMCGYIDKKGNILKIKVPKN